MNGASAGDRVGVLLPVGLETRFLGPNEDAENPGGTDPAAPGEWRVRVRVTPDEIWLDRHDPRVTEAERLALEALWSALATVPDPADPVDSLRRALGDPGWPDAFARLAGQVGAPRASWLMRTVPVVRPAGEPAAATPQPASPDREGAAILRGLPATLQVWVRWRGDPDDTPAQVLGELAPELGPVGLVLSPEQVARLARWEGAVDAGLAGEFILEARDPREILVLGVSGLGPADDSTPQSLWQAHADAGRLSVLEAGLATSSVRGQATVGPGTNASDWRLVTLEEDPTGTVSALAGPGPAVRPILASSGVSEAGRISQLLMGATFPALWGYGLAGPLGLLPANDLGPIWRWATEWLRPEGNFASLRVGSAVYGVVALADPVRLDGGDPGTLRGVAPILHLLARLGPRFAAAAEADPGLAVGLDVNGNPIGGGVDGAVRTLRRGPLPGGIGWVRSTAVELHAALTAQFTGVGVAQAIENWEARNRPALEIMGDAPARRYAARTDRVPFLPLPLLGPGLDDPAGPPVDVQDLLTKVHYIFESLQRVVVDAIGEERQLLLNPDYQSEPDSLLARLFARSLAVAGAAVDVRWLESTGTVIPDLPATILEPILSGDKGPLTRRHLAALFERGHIDLPEGDDLIHQLLWLAGEAGPEISHFLRRAANRPDHRRFLTRGLRALVESSANRWDAWFSAIGAAQLRGAYERGATPALGAYGWVDAPYRGRPGPGPGGFVLAPSLSHAATAAVFRDGAIRDPEPSLWSLEMDSGTVGPAQRLLEDLASGWHPAEVLGRMIERHFGDALSDDDSSRTEGLRSLRKEYPLRSGAGQVPEPFGCCHGLDVLKADLDAVLQNDPWQSLPPSAGDALRAAVTAITRVVDTAADLELAEGVHDFLAGNPARAARATKTLSGEISPGGLDLLDPARPARAVHTLVLAALPAATPDGDSAGGCAALAAPGFDAALATQYGGPGAWDLTVHYQDVATAIPLSALGLRPADAVTLDDESLTVIARLAARLGGEPRIPVTVTVPEAITGGRDLARLLRGRCADADDLRPPQLNTEDGAAARAQARSALQMRVDLLMDRAKTLADGLENALAEAASYDELVTIATIDPAVDDPEPAGPSSQDLASLVLAVAAWGGPVPGNAEELLAPDPLRQPQVRADVLAALARAHSELRARLEGAADALAADTIASGRRDPAIDPASSSALANALTRLTGSRTLPIGSPLPLNLLGAVLSPVAGTETATDWLPAIARVRPRLAELAGVAGEHVAWSAVSPTDPWRVGALAEAGSDPVVITPSPRLEVVVTPGAVTPGETAEWIVIDAFTESVPESGAVLGAAFDAATPGASPPQAVLLVPPPDPDRGLGAEELPAAVLHARALARIRMADPAVLGNAGLGALAAYAALPQEAMIGCPLVPFDEIQRNTFDDVGILQPRTTHADTDDVIAAVTADPLWMLGVQWRLGEHAGEDAATPAAIASVLEDAPLDAPLTSAPVESTVESPGTWDPSDLAYSTELHAGEVSLKVLRHPGGPFDWWAVTADGIPEGTVREVHSVPGRMVWPGAPRRRYWQIEDVQHDPAGAGPDAARPATLHLLRLLSRHGDDWYLVPLPANVGSIMRPQSVTLIDAAGGRWKLRTPTDWRLFAVEGLDPLAPAIPADDDPDAGWHRALPVFATATTALAGPAIEEIGLAVDEESNLLWAAVLRVGGDPLPPDPGPAEALRLTTPQEGPLDAEWQLRSAPPSNRVPYLYGGTFNPPAYGAGSDLFVQGRLLDPVDGTYQALPATDLLAVPANQGSHVLRPLAVPSSGLRLEQQDMLARDVAGNPIAWVRRRRRPLDVNTDVPLRWDLLIE